MNRITIRDHRKILVCDQNIAFIGGFNISTEYKGDGVQSGWRDLGMKLSGPIASELAHAVDQMFSIADFQHRPFERLRRSLRQRLLLTEEARLLLGAPGRQVNPIKQALLADLKNARDVQIMCAYFLPNWRFRHELMRIARQGARVRLILPAKSDVPLSQLASRSLFRRLMRAGIEIFEYEPQILHAKLFIIDGVVYAGSANLDFRSLHSNYELLVRIEEADVAAEAREIFNKDLARCKKIDLEEWTRSRTFWTRLKQRWAYFILARVDPFITKRQFKMLR